MEAFVGERGSPDGLSLGSTDDVLKFVKEGMGFAGSSIEGAGRG